MTNLYWSHVVTTDAVRAASLKILNAYFMIVIMGLFLQIRSNKLIYEAIEGD